MDTGTISTTFSKWAKVLFDGRMLALFLFGVRANPDSTETSSSFEADEPVSISIFAFVKVFLSPVRPRNQIRRYWSQQRRKVLGGNGLSVFENRLRESFLSFQPLS